jgi:hypothetical protein
MLLEGELSLLHTLARDRWSGMGRIVDAGCFFGGSTVALAHGLRAAGVAPAKQIASYDLFVMATPYSDAYPELVDGLVPGDSFRPRFDAAVGEELLGYVDVHEGDLTQQRWTGEPIVVLFYDVGMGWALNDHVLREFFPALVANRSILIQQDYIHEMLPWLHISMELLADHFRLVDFVPGTASAVFACTKAIRPGDVPADLRRDLPDAVKLRLFDRAAERFRDGSRGVLECARAVLLHDLGDREGALEHLDRTLERFGGFGRTQGCVATVRQFVEQSPA